MLFEQKRKNDADPGTWICTSDINKGKTECFIMLQNVPQTELQSSNANVNA